MRLISPPALITLAALLAAALPSVGEAQTTTATSQAETDIGTALDKLAMNSGFRFDIAGTQTDVNSSGQKTVIPIGGTMYYLSTTSATGAPFIQVDLFETYNGYKTFEMIADGNTLWVYRPASPATATNAGAYSATVYGSPGPAGTPANPNYLHDLMTALTLGARSSGRSSYAVRLVRELFENATPTYHSWIPLVVTGPTEFSSPNAYQDPITGLFADPATGLENPTAPTVMTNTEYVEYNNAPMRAIAFELAISSGTPTLNRVYYSEFQALPKRTRITAWTLTPNVISSFAQANFAPYPATQLRGWLPTIGPRIGH